MSAAFDVRSIPKDVLDICARLRQAGHEAFLVGGAVRDLLLGRPTEDYDVATSAEPTQVMSLFGHRFAIPTGLAHGTVTVRTPEDRNVEVTTYRGEGAYSDGRHPDQVFFVRTIDEDLARRDFTVNAMAYDPASESLRDPWAGQTDLGSRMIRAVGNPVDRFREDGLRPLRAVRLVAQLGFDVEPMTLSAIAQTRDMLDKVSAERVRDELLKLLGSEQPARGLRLMIETGLLGIVLPEVSEGQGVKQNRFHSYDVLEHTLRTVEATPSRDPVVRFAALLHDVAKPRTAAPRPEAPSENTFYNHEIVGADLAVAISKRLRLRTKDTERLRVLVAQHMFYYTPQWTDGTVLRFLRRVGPENVADLLALRVGDVVARGRGEDPEQEIGELRRRIDQALEAQAVLKVTDLAVSGSDVMAALGCGPGKLVGDILRQLLERVTDDPSLNQKETLLALLPELGAKAQL